MLKTRLTHPDRTLARARPRLRARRCLLSDGLRRYEFDATNRLANVTTGAGISAPTTKYVHNAQGQRLFKTEPLYAPIARDKWGQINFYPHPRNPPAACIRHALIDYPIIRIRYTFHSCLRNTLLG